MHDDLLVGLGVLGARGARLNSADQRQGDLALQLDSRLSQVEDADLSEAALDFSRSQSILELAQATGARILQTSMLQSCADEPMAEIPQLPGTPSKPCGSQGASLGQAPASAGRQPRGAALRVPE